MTGIQTPTQNQCYAPLWGLIVVSPHIGAIMRNTFLVLSVLIIGCTQTVGAQSAPASDPTAKYQAIYDKCIESNQAEDVVEFNEAISLCIEKATSLAKADLNSTYKALYDSLIRDERTYDAGELEKAQKAWIAYRDSHCEFSRYFIGQQGVDRCYLRMTAERAAEISDYLES